MIEEDPLFDYEDNIVITKDKVILQKKKNLETKAQKHKFNDLDGVWEVEVVEDGYSESLDLINDDIIYDMYTDMIYRSKINDVLTRVTLGSLTDFIFDCQETNCVHDQVWEKYEEYKLYGMKNPHLQEWSSHFMLELHYLYNLYHSVYNLKLGKPDDFIRFCYDNSDTKRLPLF